MGSPVQESCTPGSTGAHLVRGAPTDQSYTSGSVRVELREGLLYSTRFIHIVLRQYYGKQVRRQGSMPIHIN